MNLREAIVGRDHAICHLIATGMPRTDEMQFGPRPRLREFPRGDRRAAQVEATVDQRARNPGQPVGLAQQNAVLEPGAVMEVVRDDLAKAIRK